MSSFSIKRSLFTQLARIGKAISQPNRLELLDYLAQSPYNVETLSKLSGLSIANTSQHLKQLKLAGLIESDKQGQHVFYQISGNDVVQMMELVRHVAENHLAEINHLMQQHLDPLDSTEAISANDLEQRIATGEVKVIDVRPIAEYESGHITDSEHMPLDQLMNSINTLKSCTEIVAYCRGPYCVYSYEAIAILRREGINVRRYEAGFPEWKAQGRAVTEISA
ncbi:MAG: metalloregulator ArsR/SmtB family transcription factor [Methylococcales bacterium]|jgi:rhodanese-related sulfurtransferase/DNA-binding transcriptional ArsR family regulator|nr:metalloregulator ArsR/SmtB family transcription factor [Methylococcales bacterium]MBT7443846.1 metalloregulator ArsR/SmtB family transcription factor [Methylococcales bacterium]